MSSNKRFDYIDFYRGIGIILMIMGHIGFGNIFDKWIHAFHMPMFFLISGYLFNIYKDNKKIAFHIYFKKKFRQLIIPYIFFGLIFLLFTIVGNYNNNSIILEKIYALFFINTENMPLVGAIWFLTSLFFADIIYYFICQINNNKLRILISFMLSLLGILISSFCRLPYAIDVSLVAVFFMDFGFIININKSEIFKIKKWNIIIILITNTILIFVNGYINMRMGKYSFIPLFYINAIVSSIILIYISKKINDFIIKNRIMLFVKEFIITIGANSITYLILNEIDIRLVIFILNKMIIPNKISKIITFLIVIVILWLQNKILNYKKLKILIGKS